MKTDWEVELAVVIGRRCRHLDSTAQALESIAGYTISHDVSEREFQLEFSPQWDLGKSCETFNPMGPWLVTADEVADPQDLGLRLSVNGVKRQDGHTRDMIFPVEAVRHRWTRPDQAEGRRGPGRRCRYRGPRRSMADRRRAGLTGQGAGAVRAVPDRGTGPIRWHRQARDRA